eukprot:jgi/Astpho2/1522/Aster-x1011
MYPTIQQAGTNVPIPAPPAGQYGPTPLRPVAEPYRTEPPVMVSADLNNIPRVEFAFDCSFERKLVADFEAEQQNGSAGTDPASAQVTPDDEFTLSCEKYAKLGYDREVTMMALAACGTQPENKQKIVQFCENYTYLKSMGFRVDLIAGALLLHPDSLQEASEACLNAS